MYLAGFLGMQGLEFIIIIIVGLLLFGKKLPGIARSLGQSVVEFKKGIKGVKDDAEVGSQPGQLAPPPQQGAPVQYAQPQQYAAGAPAPQAGQVIDTAATVRPPEPAKTV